MENNLKRQFIWNTLGSGLTSFISLLFLIIVTRINGTDVAGVFTLTFATALMFYTVALYSGRTYQVTETDDTINDDDFIKHRFIMSLLMILFSVLFALLNKYNSFKITVLMLLCFAKVLEAISDVYHGILQKNKRLDIVGKSLLIRSLSEILVLIAVDMITKSIILSCVSLIIVNLLVLLFIDIRVGNKYKDEKKYNINSIKKIFILGFFTFGLTFISNYLYNIPRYALDTLASDTLQAIYGIIIMPATIIMVVNMFVIQPLIVVLKELYRDKNKKKFIKCMLGIIGITVLTGLLAIIVAYYFGIPVLELLYGVELGNYLYGLLLVIVGATFYTVASVLSNAMIVLRKTRIQFAIYVILLIASYFMSRHLVETYLFNGAVYSYTIMMFGLVLLYTITFVFIINKKRTWE